VDIIKTLANGILAAIPELMPVILDVLMQIGNLIVELAPVLIEAGLNIIVQLAMGIAQALPELIPTIVEVVLNIALYLLENIDILMDAAIQLMIGLATGLINAIPILIEKAPLIINAWSQAMITSALKLIEVGQKIIEVIGNALTTYGPQLLSKAAAIINDLKARFIEAASRFLEVGAAIVNGIKEGIAGAWTQFTNWLYTMLGDIVQGVKDFFKIGSPSKVFADEVGRWIPAGIAEGIQEGMNTLDDAMVDMTMSISPDQMQGVTTYNPTSGTVTVQGVLNQVYSMLAQYLPIIASGENVNVQLGVDNQQIFKVVQSEAKRNQQITGMGGALI
jgi:phage-related protein